MTDPTEHLLALKVMRLTRPTLVNSQIVTAEAKDLPQNTFDKILEGSATTVQGSETLAAGQFMLLPQSFGSIYLGETFSSYVCVHNCRTHPVTNVTVKADLQSNNTRINLPIHVDKQGPMTLSPDETLDDVIHHEVKEIGTHILVCEVSYLTPAGLETSFRKFFKFEVVKPLDVMTKFYNAETDEVYLEAQIQNITMGPICLEKVELESSEQYTVVPLNTLPSGESVFTQRTMLQTQNSCQYLYCIKPIPEILNDPKALKAANNIGKLDIVWRSNLGERGRLQTSQLQRSPIEYGDLRLAVIEAESTCKIGQAFDFKCRVTNTSERSMDLVMNLNTKAKIGCGYTGQTEISLGALEPGKSQEFSLTVCPVRLGLITVSNLQLTDVFMKRKYEFDDFVQVFVVDEDYKEDNFHLDKYVRYSIPQPV
ncbi:probable trafficking protein particle complex subunit 13 homolog [Toxorhynchites rutilus septentrionalis]|uniref:probable trafficking protein particle complex subunit 13 homolog n=1 Tax=Toxorhynchites rutilus septentrionalis TaxID=329112 RepID=UPI00247943E8|nr:probable trafficking protein particle complex subunit 13 homolog [Toxorhynchites rutilus septentrionalis]